MVTILELSASRVVGHSCHPHSALMEKYVPWAYYILALSYQNSTVILKWLTHVKSLSNKTEKHLGRFLGKFVNPAHWKEPSHPTFLLLLLDEAHVLRF